jgi:hypothetical protein
VNWKAQHSTGDLDGSIAIQGGRAMRCNPFLTRPSAIQQQPSRRSADVARCHKGNKNCRELTQRLIALPCVSLRSANFNQDAVVVTHAA